jgi:hypothetical protein
MIRHSIAIANRAEKKSRLKNQGRPLSARAADEGRVAPMLNANNLSENAMAFANKHSVLCKAIRDTEQRNRETALENVYQFLKKEFPAVVFDRTRIELENNFSSTYSMAAYEDIDSGRFRVYGDGTVYSRKSDYALDFPNAQFRAEGSSTVGLVKSRNGRECSVVIYSKPKGIRINTYAGGYLRLTHEDDYGSTYIVLDKEKCYLEPLTNRTKKG